MKKYFITPILLLMSVVNSTNAQTTAVKKQTYTAPFNATIYTLDNGLKLYLSVNKDEPRLQTYIAVRAGSKYDPAQTTGLAHYLEHMMFKGTHKLATKDWEKEKVLLQKISDLYEKHLQEKDPEKKRAIYAEIDKTSHDASAYAIPNEYDKIVTSLGATGTNAYTSNDQTVYVNNIPSSELEKWLKLESERFSTLVLRLFHTELETVYEEYNMNQDNDNRWAYANLLKGLFPNHPYGTQTTIGEGEHLKNPSMVNIHNYFNTYYNPNNIAICLAGDIDPEKTYELVNKYFGTWKSQPIPAFDVKSQPEITAPIEKVTLGPQEEFVYLGYRFPAAKSDDILKLRLIDQILANGKAGLIDLDLVQSQKVLQAYSSPNTLKDFSVHILFGKPRENQKLEEVKDLLLAEVEKVKKGDFEEWMVQAAINDIRLEKMKAYESNNGRADAFVDAFIYEQDWSAFTQDIEKMKKITKADIVVFANKYYKNNYVISYKRKGQEDRPKVEKPKITPVIMNRDAESSFASEIQKMPSASVKPVFPDFTKAISNATLSNTTTVEYTKNTENELFRYYFIADAGTDNELKLGLLSSYINYLGTEKYTASEFKRELFKLGLAIETSAQRDKFYIKLSGLNTSFEKGVALLNELITTAKPNPEAYQEMVNGILKQRKNNKVEKMALFRGMVSFAKYGEVSPYTNIIQEEDLKELKAADLTALLKSFTQRNHHHFYYGSSDLVSVQAVLNKSLASYKPVESFAEAKKFTPKSFDKKRVYFYNYPGMVQAQLMFVAKDVPFNVRLNSQGSLFNEYFGSGLSSIVFQEIREQKALAYSAYAQYAYPDKVGDDYFVQAFVGTQADKLETAATEMEKLLNKMPKVEAQFQGARASTLKQIASERFTRDNIFWRKESMKKLGLKYDIREDIYEQVQYMNLDSLELFFNSHIANKNFAYVIMGDKSKLDWNVVSKLGEVIELNTKDIFGY